MKREIISAECIMLCIAICSNSATASTTTIGPNGINSAGLTLANGMPMNGDGVAIGQVELTRPGKRIVDGGFDDGLHSSSTVNPTNVFVRTVSGAGIANMNVDDHAEQVASIIISPDMVDPDGAGPMVAPTGVATMADLYSSATNPVGPNFDEEASITLNHLATLPGVDIRAINMSFQNGRLPGSLNDGNQLLTQFVDWSAGAHDVLYVAAGKNGNSPAANSIPTDNFNGITIARSIREGADYRRVSGGNDFSQDAERDRTSISLIAPGDGVDATGLNNVVSPVNGASFAAPHVTGTVALLLQYANERIGAGAAGWDAVRSRRHETMKAVLLNSADKFIDNGTVRPPGQVDPVPQGALLGMTRTVLKEPQPAMPPLPAKPNPTWFDSEAWDDSNEGIGSRIPLDVEMGAGHLNASRARTQFATGEHGFEVADIPVIGWDYGTTTGAADINRYQFAGELLGGTFISITLAWDRKVEFQVDTAPVGQYNAGDTFEEYIDDGLSPPDDSVIDDLDIYLLPKFAGSITQTIAASDSAVGTLEHLFFQIPETGEYEFWVRQHDEDAGVTQNYAVAWWAVAELTSTPQGDYNGDMIVDAQDYNFWRTNFGGAVSPGTGADGNGNGVIDAADYVVWRNSFTAGSGSLASVPEPTCLMLLAAASVLLAYRRSEYGLLRDSPCTLADIVRGPQRLNVPPIYGPQQFLAVV